MTADERNQLFETLPVRQAVRRQIVPAIISQMIALIYNLADTYFVGMRNSPTETAAVTVAYSSFVMLTAISNLFGVGGASAIARALGRRETGRARELAAVSFWFGLASAALFSLLFITAVASVFYFIMVILLRDEFVIGYLKRFKTVLIKK